MIKVAIIHDAPVPTPSSKQLLLEFIKRGVKTSYLRISRLSIRIEGNEISIYYGRRRKLSLNACVVRGLGVALSTEFLFRRFDIIRGIEESGVLVVNPPESMLIARDKLRTVIRLKQEGINVPDTAVVEDVFEAVEIVRNWGTVVVKPIIGSLGYGSLKISDPDIMYVIARTWLSHGQPIYIQKFTRSTDRDIRVFVVGDEVLGAIYRYAPPNSWKTNVAQGGRVEKASVDEEVKELAIKSTKALGLLYAGVDIGECEGDYVVYEVNSAPQWSGFMSATGINPASKIADLVIKLIKK